jgi:hypothetical protein
MAGVFESNAGNRGARLSGDLSLSGRRAHIGAAGMASQIGYP